MAKKKIIIIGAGLAGLSAAWHLQKRGIDCQILEKEFEVARENGQKISSAKKEGTEHG